MSELNIIRLSETVAIAKPIARDNLPALTLLEIISVEPRIAEILITLKPARGLHKRLLQYSGIKRRLSRLVGWGAERAELRNSQAYEVVMRIVCDKLNV